MTTTTCTAQKQIRIESQLPQTAHCYLPAGHDGPHEAGILDSDDNPVAERWFTPTPAPECCHPRSCTCCFREGVPCGGHHIGDPGHESCTGFMAGDR